MMGCLSRKEKQNRAQEIAIHQGEEKDLFAKAAYKSAEESGRVMKRVSLRSGRQMTIPQVGRINIHGDPCVSLHTSRLQAND
jgi:hypothetical protein